MIDCNFPSCELPVAFTIPGLFHSSTLDLIYNLHLSMKVLPNSAFLDQRIPGMIGFLSEMVISLGASQRF